MRLSMREVSETDDVSRYNDFKACPEREVSKERCGDAKTGEEAT